MAAENMKNLNTRIRLKYDTLENWIKNDPVLLAGEVAIATVANNETNANSTKFQNLPNVVMKVGDGTKKFSELNYFSAMAADVYAWAKKTESEANESFRAYMEGNTDHTDWLKSFISGEVKDTNTNYKLEQDANNGHILCLYSQNIGQEDWTLVNEITTADTVYDDTALAGRVTGLETKVDTGDKTVTAYIADAIAALDLDNKYDAKGAAAQALADAKTYADGKDAAIKAAQDAADAAQGEIDALEEKVGEVPADKTVIGMIGENATAISGEATRAANAEAALAAKIGEVAEGENLADKLAAEVERATQAEGVNAAAAAAAQKTADDLKTYVGTLPEGTEATTVVDYIDKKTADIASNESFTQLEGRVKDIEDDYLVEADKTELTNAINGKVASVTAKDNSVVIGGEATAPTVGVQISASAGNALALADDGLMVTIPTAAEYSIVKDETAGDGYAATYHLTKDGENVGAAINIPKDMVVQSGTVVTDPEGQPAGTYIKLVLANADNSELYIPVDTLIEYVTSGSQVGDMVVINVSDDHKVTATITDGTITAAKLTTEVQTALNKAHTHANAEELDKIAVGDKAKWDAAEAKAHEHANKDLLDTYTQTEADLADAVAKKHEHANAEELAKFVDGDKAKLDDAAAKAHEHKNLELLETYTQTEADLADAVAKKHEHENAEVLGGITAEKVAAWDAAEGNAKGYADELNTAMDERVTKNTNDIAGLHAIAKSGNVNDLEQTEGEYIVFNCGTSSTII